MYNINPKSYWIFDISSHITGGADSNATCHMFQKGYMYVQK